MARLLHVHDIDQFADAKRIPDDAITHTIIGNVRQLREEDEIEPFLRQILHDADTTPHGPTEIADILTTHLHIKGQRRLAAFVVKGKSFNKVRARDTAHQFARLRQLPGLEVMVFLAVGHIQDRPKRDFVQAAHDADCDHLIVDAQDCARLFLAYQKICPADGTPYDETGTCREGHELDDGIRLQWSVRETARYEVVSLKDVSHAGAKRYKAFVLLDRHYDKEVLREIIVEATKRIRSETYMRNSKVAARWGNSDAQVVWLFIACEPQDIRTANWVCRTSWIDDALEDNMRPLGEDGDDKVEGIEISWNDDYESMRTLYDTHSAPKGEYLQAVKPILQKMRDASERAAAAFDAFTHGRLSGSKLIERMQAERGPVAELYRASGNVPFPPEDCRDYNERFHCLCAVVDDMFLLYSEDGLKTWPSKNRQVLMRDAVERFHEDLRGLEAEEQKLH